MSAGPGAIPLARWRRVRAVVPVLVTVAALVVLAPLVLPHAPDALDLAARRAMPSLSHPFGTDDLGRDVLSRVAAGARISLALGLLSALVAAAVGSGVGAAAGYGGGWLDVLLMRTTDAMLSMPRLPLLMVVAALVRPSVAGLVLIVGLAGWMEVARLVRAEVRSLRARDFVAAARAAGATSWRVVVHHLLPLVAPTIVVAATIAVGRNILLESALSFFGVGVQPPAASWGSMLYQAQTSLSTEPWLAIFPGAMIFLAVLLANRLGETMTAD